LDTNDDPAGEWDAAVTEAIAHTDVFLPNENEALALARVLDGNVLAAVRYLADLTGLPVVKRGALGALAWYEGGMVSSPGLPAHDPIDTVGAGDSFNAGFLTGWLGGLPVADSLQLAAACGSLSTRAAGGTAAQPTLAEASRAMRASVVA
jgi:sugar/nucleoside kinase (ribokinase family)